MTLGSDSSPSAGPGGPGLGFSAHLGPLRLPFRTRTGYRQHHAERRALQEGEPTQPVTAGAWSQALGRHFGWESTANGRGPCAVRHVTARASVYFDVLNQLGLDVRLELEHFSGQSVEAVRQDFGAGGAAALSPTPAPVVVPVAPLLAL